MIISLEMILTCDENCEMRTEAIFFERVPYPRLASFAVAEKALAIEFLIERGEARLHGQETFDKWPKIDRIGRYLRSNDALIVSYLFSMVAYLNRRAVVEDIVDVFAQRRRLVVRRPEKGSFLVFLEYFAYGCVESEEKAVSLRFLHGIDVRHDDF